MSRLKKCGGTVTKFPNSNYSQHQSIQSILEYAKTLNDIESSSLNYYYNVEDYIKSLDITNYYYNDIYGPLEQIRKTFSQLESCAEEASKAVQNLFESLETMSKEPGPSDE